MIDEILGTEPLDYDPGTVALVNEYMGEAMWGGELLVMPVAELAADVLLYAQAARVNIYVPDLARLVVGMFPN